MPLPVPSLDDRRFQDLVDDAKRLVQQRCPQWTDHNVHDPGVTLIELFAWMTDQLVYRVNRLPDRLVVSFLDLMGVQLAPPSSARVDQTFWLSAPQPQVLLVPAGTAVATVRSPQTEPVVFTTLRDLEIVPCELQHLRSALTDGSAHDHTDALARRTPLTAFRPAPAPGDALLVGLSAAVPCNAVVLRADCRVEGVGVDPRDPPLVWEAWTGRSWSACEVDSDGTGGLNRAGDVVLHVPPGHTTSLVEGQRAGWLRARVLEPREGQPAYSASPAVHALTAFTIGGTVEAADAQDVGPEELGVSEGVPGQVFRLKRTPVVQADAPFVVDVSEVGLDGEPTGWQAWERVPDFAESGPDDQHVVLDPVTGEVRLGPAVREADGRLTRHGAVPAKGARLRVRAYRVGGGARGNVGPGLLVVPKSSLPYVSATTNRCAAVGGRDAETVEEARVRGPLALRARGRAVTAEDVEQLALESCREVARVRAVPVPEQAGVRVLVVPTAAQDRGRLSFGQLVPPEHVLRQVAAHLEPRRVVGTRLVVEPPTYQGITVVARLRATAAADVAALQAAALQALYERFSPLPGGGPDGTGWPFGRPVHVGEVYATLSRLPGVELVEDARLFPADPVSGERGETTARVPLDRDALVFSYEHQVLVQPALP